MISYRQLKTVVDETLKTTRECVLIALVVAALFDSREDRVRDAELIREINAVKVRLDVQAPTNPPPNKIDDFQYEQNEIDIPAIPVLSTDR